MVYKQTLAFFHVLSSNKKPKRGGLMKKDGYLRSKAAPLETPASKSPMHRKLYGTEAQVIGFTQPSFTG